jgi:hypothetical protein
VRAVAGKQRLMAGRRRVRRWTHGRGQPCCSNGKVKARHAQAQTGIFSQLLICWGSRTRQPQGPGCHDAKSGWEVGEGWRQEGRGCDGPRPGCRARLNRASDGDDVCTLCESPEGIDAVGHERTRCRRCPLRLRGRGREGGRRRGGGSGWLRRRLRRLLMVVGPLDKGRPGSPLIATCGSEWFGLLHDV